MDKERRSAFLRNGGLESTGSASYENTVKKRGICYQRQHGAPLTAAIDSRKPRTLHAYAGAHEIFMRLQAEGKKRQSVSLAGRRPDLMDWVVKSTLEVLLEDSMQDQYDDSASDQTALNRETDLDTPV